MYQYPLVVKTCLRGSRLGQIGRHRLPLRRHRSTLPRALHVSEEVQQAIFEHKPVVALETTIYTHGFPYPDNLSLATELETLVRANGGIPATIGILDGVAKVGFATDELARLVSSAGSSSTLKVSRRDLGFACALKDQQGKPFSGGTTISGTMILAHLAGIKVFGTGGLGGVHRGVEETMDVSADLTELGRTPVTVISSGCKSFLDLPRTLEYLETQGVAVATFADGRTGAVDFPSFYSRDSGTKSPKILIDELEAAKVIYAHLSLGLSSGLVFANPIPEEHSIPFPKMEACVHEALNEAKNAGVTGAAATPYILAKIKEITEGKVIPANRALIASNVVRATKVAKALVEMEVNQIRDGPKWVRLSSPIRFLADTCSSHPSAMTGPAASNYTLDGVSRGVSAPSGVVHSSIISESETTRTNSDVKPRVFVAGSLALDLACDYAPRTHNASSRISDVPALHTSNPAHITQSLGGVGSNVARAAHLMGADVQLCSAVGDDLSGRTAIEALSADGMSTNGVKIVRTEEGSRTAQYIALNDSNKELYLAVADMSILESDSTEPDSINAAFSNVWLPQMQSSRPSHLVVDANWSPKHLSRWLEAGKKIGAHVTFEPVSNMKSTGVFSGSGAKKLSVFPNPSIHLATPNVHELAAIHKAAQDHGSFDRNDWWEVIDAFGIPHSGARPQLALATSNELVDRGIPQQALQLLPFMPSICTKLGADGVLLTQIIPANDARLTSGDYAPYILSRCANGTEDTLGVGGVYVRLFPAHEKVEQQEIISVNGVGDTFVGTIVAGLAAEGKAARVEDLVDLAQRAAVLTLKSKESVSTALGTLRMLL